MQRLPTSDHRWGEGGQRLVMCRRLWVGIGRMLRALSVVCDLWIPREFGTGIPVQPTQGPSPPPPPPTKGWPSGRDPQAPRREGLRGHFDSFPIWGGKESPKKGLRIVPLGRHFPPPPPCPQRGGPETAGGMQPL